MRVPFIDLRETYRELNPELDAAHQRVMSSGRFILGQELEAFEMAFAEYCGVKHCIGVNSGTDALHLALRACGIGPADEVITVAHTFIATTLAIIWTGATPIFVDIDPETYTLDSAQLESAISKRSKAIVPVHIYGHCADLDAILSIAESHGLYVIEDAAQAQGARYKGKRAGSVGDLGCFSFYPTKNLGAYGDAGAIICNDDNLADLLKKFRNYGQEKKYYHSLPGYNSRLDELQAAYLRIKLCHLDRWNDYRRQIARIYRELLIETEVACPTVPSYSEHVYYVYAIQSNKRDRLAAYLKSNGVETLVHYPVPVHLQQVFSDLAWTDVRLPRTELLSQRTLSLPMFPYLNEEQVSYVAELIADFN